jgi:uncharacterized protein YbcI
VHVPAPSESSQIEQAISEDLLRIHRESYGRGPSRARTYVLEDDVVCIMDGLELLPSEELLIDKGHADAVLGVRTKYEQAIEASFKAAVERATGRRVIAFASHTAVDPNFAVEVFRLEPHGPK